MTSRFPEHAHADFAAVRAGHFWFETRREILTEIVSSLPPKTRGGIAIEVGCGDCFVLEELPGRWFGIDSNLFDLAQARARNLHSALASAEALPIRPPVSVIALFDILEHFDSPRTLLDECRKLLAPDGTLLVTVPAGQNLWTSRDEYAGHFLRYSRDQLLGTLAQSGFRVRKIFPLFRCLWPLAWLSARFPPAHPEGSYSVGPAANRVLRQLLSWEWRLLRQSAFGIGTSWCCIAEPAAAERHE